MTDSEHVRHRPPRELAEPRQLVVVCSPIRSNVNLSRIGRLAGCCGLRELYVIGPGRLDPKIARDAAQELRLHSRRTLLPLLKDLRSDGYQLVGLEQATRSENLHTFQFERRTALIIGSEREGLGDEALAQLDRVVEIPVWGLPYSYNVATATTMAMYEYCRQFPDG